MSVHIENLRVSFGPLVAVHGLSLAIEPGECVALVGESGSGKSVTGRSLVGLTGGTVTADRLEVAGRDIRSATRRDLERLRGGVVGSISQDALVALDPLRTVGREVDDALRLHTALSPVERRMRVRELLAECGIPDPEVRAGQRSGQLSGGLRQRALIAAAIAAGPRLLIADEPTTALDSQVAGGILDLVARQRDAGMAVLLISHDLAVVRRIASRVVIMRDGAVVEEGPVDDVLRAPRHPYTRALLAALPAGRPRGQRLLSPRPPSVAPPARPPVSAQGAPVLAARGLSIRFGERPVLDEVSFELRAGETLGLVGPSGSGKTTIARIALGLQRPDAGELELLGAPWSGLTERERRSRRGTIGAVYQDPLGSFDPRHTVGRILRDAGGSPGLLASVGLDDALATRRPRSLSGGQRQRVAIARAIAAEPRVLVLDEPVSALDVQVQAQVLDLLDDLQQRLGLAYLFISHDVDVIAHMSDRVLDLGAAGTMGATSRHPFT